MRVVVAAATDVGLVRANNEDSFLVDDEHGCYAVADGMGGHRGGEVASATAIEALRAEIARGTALDAAIAIANDAVLTKAAADPELAGMGTTLTGVVVTGDTVTIGHVGDSRAYLIRDGALRMLTDDHSLVGEWIRAGRLTVEQAEVHPQRSVITRCLGSSIDVAVDVITLTPAAGDRLVLCSDGLTTMLRDPAILDIAGTDDEPAEVARRLVAAACGAGGDDNVTVVVLDVEDVGVGIPTTPTAAAAAPPDRSVADPPAVAPSPAPVTPSRNRRRSALLLLAPVLVIAVAVGVLGWYARRSYFIGERAGVVVIFQGVPGGVIGWNPTLREETDPPLRVDALRPDQQLRVADNSSRGSLAALRSTVDAWRSDADARSTTTTTSTTTTLARGQRPTSTTVRRVPPIQP